ncbi:MAG: phosphotransferase [Natronosporangium sp.]
MNVFVKRYHDPQAAAAAAAHLAWLTNFCTGVRFPALRMVAGRWMVTELLTGHHPRPADLPVVAATLGTLHRSAHERHLHRARLDRPLRVGGLLISDFVTPRRAALARQPVPHTGLPAAIYKDTNVRNLLLTDAGVAQVDFDDLTLAPFGYDLAKLIVSTAMTYGQPAASLVSDTLAAYNTHVGTNACPLNRLHRYAELHGRLTAPYLHRNGYRHPWPTVRPWPAPARSSP